MDRILESLHERLAAAPPHERPAIVARLAVLLLASGRDDDADVLLADARRAATRARDSHAVAWSEIALAAMAQVRDDDARAAAHLASAETYLAEVSGRATTIAGAAWLVGVRLARLQQCAPPAAALAERADVADDGVGAEEQLELMAEIALERVVVAREGGDLRRARAELDRARELITRTGSPRLAAYFELAVGEFAASSGELESARARIKNAIDAFATNGLRRDAGRATIRYAELIAGTPGLAAGESAAAALGRAQATLDTAATWRDRLAIRTGFHAFGRRGFDRVMTEGTVSRIEAFERARGALLGALSSASETEDRALIDIEMFIEPEGTKEELATYLARARESVTTGRATTSDAISALDRTVRDLIDLIGAALVERDRLRVLLNVVSEIDASSDLASLPPLVAKAAARVLDADYVIVALDRSGELVALGHHGEPLSGHEDAWREAALSPATSPAHRPRTDPSQLAGRAADNKCGPMLAVPLRGSGFAGVLYADKLRRSGQFREQDQAIAHLLAEYVSLSLAKLHSREQERFAHHQLAVTLDAIRDGLMACDENGVVTSVNAAASRMLRVQPDELSGAVLANLPQLAALWTTLSASTRLDGAVVRLAHGSFVVTSRPIGREDDGRGFVATFTELDRAQKIAQRLSATRARYGFNDIVGASPSLNAAMAMAKRASSIDATVLITGESGTGKEVIAQAIHTAGPRASEPFVGINCAALPRELLEAELFGYEKGAFTGARADGNPGKFEVAANGTILLDEIGDMPLDMQAKMLRVLQERTVTRLGGRNDIPMQARVIATTHRDLEQLVDEGKFRMDLLFRLRVLAIELPPLRDRPEDIAQLALFHMRRFAEQQRKRLRDFGPRVLDELERYDWPGNVRELANVMEAEVSLSEPAAEMLERLATRLVGRFRTPGAATTGEWRAAPSASVLPSEQPIIPLAEVEKKAFLHALDRCNQNVAKAAEALGVSKVTFYAKLRSWGLHPRERVDEEGVPSSRWSASPTAGTRGGDEPASSGKAPRIVEEAGPSSARRQPTAPPSRRGQ